MVGSEFHAEWVVDIKEIFPQVKVPEADRKALRFLRWTDDDRNIN